MTCCFGGEGCFNTDLSGPGTIYLQSLSYQGLIRLLVKSSPPPKKDKPGAGAAPPMEEMSR